MKNSLRAVMASFAIAVSTLSAAVRAEPLPAAPSTDDLPRPPRRFSRGEAVAYGLTSAFFSVNSIWVNALPGPTISGRSLDGYYAYGTEALASAPLAVVSPGDGAAVGSLQLGIIGGGVAFHAAGGTTSTTWSPYGAAIDNFALHQAMYAAYATYRDARAAGLDETWSDRPWQPVTADQMIVAPVQGKNLKRPIVLVPVSIAFGASALGSVGYLAGSRLPSTAARDAALAPLYAWDAGVTEEAIFRGFFYEELQHGLGRWPARFIDMALFTAAHVPGELGGSFSGTQIGEGLAARAVFALLADIAYDDGGLRESVALHVLWDFALLELAALTHNNALSASILPGNATAPSGTSSNGTVIVPIAHGVF